MLSSTHLPAAPALTLRPRAALACPVPGGTATPRNCSRTAWADSLCWLLSSAHSPRGPAALPCSPQSHPSDAEVLLPSTGAFYEGTTNPCLHPHHVNQPCPGTDILPMQTPADTTANCQVSAKLPLSQGPACAASKG